VIGTMAKVAGLMNKSPWAWAGITFGICFLALFLPWPFLRVFIAGIVAGIAIFVAETIRPTQN